MSLNLLVANALQAEADALWQEQKRKGVSGANFRAITLAKNAGIIAKLDPISSAADLKGVKGIGRKTVLRASNIIAAHTGDLPPQPQPVCAPNALKPVKTKTKGSAVARAFRAPLLLLAHVIDALFDPRGYWASEKFDGMRMFYGDGILVSRAGNVIQAPPHVLKTLRLIAPGVQIDGELYCGRGKRGLTSGIKTNPSHPEWKRARFYVFDLPAMNAPFEERVAAIETLCAKFPDFLVPVKHIKVHDRAHADALLREVVAGGAGPQGASECNGVSGEGLIYRKPGSYYEGCRSLTCFKHKPDYDGDAVVCKHSKTKSSVTVRMECGKTFALNTYGKAPDKYPIGSIVNYRFEGWQPGSGIPMNARLVGRSDKTQARDVERPSTRAPIMPPPADAVATPKRKREKEPVALLPPPLKKHKREIVLLPPPTKPFSEKSICKYHPNCYRTNPAHFLRFAHPR